MTWWAEQAMFSVRDWDSYQQLMDTIRKYRKCSIQFSFKKSW